MDFKILFLCFLGFSAWYSRLAKCWVCDSCHCRSCSEHSNCFNLERSPSPPSCLVLLNSKEHAHIVRIIRLYDECRGGSNNCTATANLVSLSLLTITGFIYVMAALVLRRNAHSNSRTPLRTLRRCVASGDTFDMAPIRYSSATSTGSVYLRLCPALSALRTI
jgi:hypothetical protein